MTAMRTHTFCALLLVVAMRQIAHAALLFRPHSIDLSGNALSPSPLMALHFTVVTSTTAQSGVAGYGRDAHVASGVSIAAAAHGPPTVRMGSTEETRVIRAQVRDRADQVPPVLQRQRVTRARPTAAWQRGQALTKCGVEPLDGPTELTLR